MSADRGLPLIAGLCALCGALAAWNIADLAAGVRVAKVRMVAEANLEQAERKWLACHRGGFYTVGDAIYICASRRSDLTVAHLPEVLEAGL